MNSNYVYFIASLPMLHFDMAPPFSLKDFLQRCQEFASDGDSGILKNLPQPQNYDVAIKFMPVIQGWVDFDNALRNELARIRASRKHIDPAVHLRRDGFTSSAIAHIALGAYRNPSLLEAERSLDEARWRALDELAAGHYFDLGFLIIYTYKLMILERWEKIRKADNQVLLEKALVTSSEGINAD